MNIENILKEIKKELLILFSDHFKNLTDQSKKDLENFLSKTEEKLSRWTLLLAEQKITNEEFEWLVKSQKDLLVLTSLQEGGISKIRLSNIKNQAINTIIKTILTSII
jgi:hypothetical protein